MKKQGLVTAENSYMMQIDENGDVKEQRNALKSKDWEIYGFQNPDPFTDFRGGGLKSLQNITSFAMDYPNVLKKMIDPGNDFLMAISSINITYFLKVYFHLAEFLQISKDKDKVCPRKGFKTFC